MAIARKQKIAVIIGAGPAGLTAAYEFLNTTDIKPIVFEASADIGGISKTVVYNGNRIDIGGHRFFSKSDRVMEWWLNILPLEQTSLTTIPLHYQGKTRSLKSVTHSKDSYTGDEVMLVRSRMSRIYYDGKFFNYPVKIESSTIKNLGLKRITKIGLSYLKARLIPLNETNLENFYINRFGLELYNIFFRDYTEKVWGVPCNQIAPDWGAQRVKGLSITKAVSHALKASIRRHTKVTDLAQKKTETSLIEYFLYPKLGPGQMWETVAKRVIQNGGEVHKNYIVTKLHVNSGLVKSVTVINTKTKKSKRIRADYFISTMPIKELIECITGTTVPKTVRHIAHGLPYRDFITVGLLVKKLVIVDDSMADSFIRDNWIYIQEPGVKLGRLQIFNNWSPYLVNNTDNLWIGLEYFVNEGDDIWNKDDTTMAEFGINELAQIGIIDKTDVIDSTVIRIKKTYPAYFGTYNQFEKVRTFTDKLSNLFLVGRNGMHRYNNQDHSMLTAMQAVENISCSETSKQNIWSINVDDTYHEQK
jgi:protoporphyrinogen oxidase